MSRLIRSLFAIALLPLIWAFGRVVFDVIRPDSDAGRILWKQKEVHAFLVGCGIWVVWWIRFPRPLFLYVFAHEISHALFILLSGGRILEFHVGQGRGHVVSNRSSILISLCPYFLPLYSLVLIVLYGAGVSYWGWEPYRLWFYGALGLTWMFHLTFTVWAISRQQPDLKNEGNIFSLKLILAVNLFLILMALVFVSPGLTFQEALGDAFGHFQRFWGRFFSK